MLDDGCTELEELLLELLELADDGGCPKLEELLLELLEIVDDDGPIELLEDEILPELLEIVDWIELLEEEILLELADDDCTELEELLMELLEIVDWIELLEIDDGVTVIVTVVWPVLHSESPCDARGAAAASPSREEMKIRECILSKKKPRVYCIECS